MTKTALISVYDKTGLTPFAKRLSKLGWTLIASGGTAKVLNAAGLKVTKVSKLTGYPHMLAGRVKTLHPVIHAGILATNSKTDKKELKDHLINPIDMVICNLYPFQETISKKSATLTRAIEQIDIGGVTLLRAAAKNHSRVTVVSDPKDYPQILKELTKSTLVSKATRQLLAAKAFTHTAAYDTTISNYLNSFSQTDKIPQTINLSLNRIAGLRYGENPHQQAAYFATNNIGPLGSKLLSGKALSYTNLLDIDATWRTAVSFSKPTVVIVKHLCPTGIATAKTIAQAFPAALSSDSISAFGGIIAANRPVTMNIVNQIAKVKLFVEAIIAPKFDTKAVSWYKKNKPDVRLLETGSSTAAVTLAGSPGVDWNKWELRSIRGNFVLQERDQGDPITATWRVVSKRKPTRLEVRALKYAWHCVHYVKSNAIVLSQNTVTVGIGGGVSSRVDAVKLAVAHAGKKAIGAAMASDAFFPFADGIEAAAQAGVTAIVQPGGSIRDKQVLKTVNDLNLAMVYTNTRHFLH